MIGVLTFGVETGFLVILVKMCGIPDLIAKIGAAEAALLFKFCFNDRWTFKIHRSDVPVVLRLCRFHAASVGGVGLSWLLFTLSRAIGFSLITAQLIAVCLVFPVTFFIAQRWVWRKRP